MHGFPVVCRLQCGCCCDHWRDVWDDAPESQTACTYMNKDGCALSREDRPWACNSYQCEISKAFDEGAITKEQAEKFIELGFFHNRHMWKPHLGTK